MIDFAEQSRRIKELNRRELERRRCALASWILAAAVCVIAWYYIIRGVIALCS